MKSVCAKNRLWKETLRVNWILFLLAGSLLQAAPPHADSPLTQKPARLPADGIASLTRAQAIAKANAIELPGAHADEINLLFLQIQRLRLRQEIQELGKPIPEESKRPWISESRRHIKELKTASLQAVEEAWKKTVAGQGSKVPFDSLRDVYALIKKESPQLEAQMGFSTQGTISKKSYGESARPLPIGSAYSSNLDEGGDLLKSIELRESRRQLEVGAEAAMRSILNGTGKPLLLPKLVDEKPNWLDAINATPRLATASSNEIPQFISALKAEKVSVSAALDLSAYFPPPTHQEGFACVGHAIATNAAAANGSTPALSPISTYSRLTQGCGDAAPIESVAKALASLSDKRILASDPSNGSHRVEGFVQAQGKPSPSDLKKLIQAKQPPIVELRTDARSYLEDYITPVGGESNVRHVINLVGFGRGVNPEGKEEDYFTVMDSFAPLPMTYKISASNLVENTVGLYRVTKVAH